MADSRMLQTTLANLIGGTRFKIANKGVLKHTVCPKCNEELDSWRHCAECYGLKISDIHNEKQWLQNIRQLMEKIKTDTPGKYKEAEAEYQWPTGNTREEGNNQK